MALRNILNESEVADHIPLCFASVNNSCPKFTYPTVIRMTLYVFLGTIAVITVVGNLLVIITVIHFKQLHTPTNYLILSLAITDLLLGVLLMPPCMVRFVETCWYFGDLYCKIYSGTDVMLCNASIFNLSFIAVDRYYAICHPLSYQTTITPSVTVVMIFISWSVPALAGFGIIFLELNIMGYEEFYYNNVYCEGACIFFVGELAGVMCSIILLYIPGVIMLSIYAKIYVIAQKQARSIQDKHHTNGKNSSGASKIKRKATRTLAIIMGVFLMLWLPFFVCFITDPLTGNAIPPLIFDMVGWIGFFNSSCNPIVYALFYSWFRKAFKVILFGKVFQPNSSSLNLFSG